MACACGWDTTEKLKKFGVMDVNVLVISVYFLHPTAIPGTQFLSTLISPFTEHLQGTFKMVLMACKTSRKTPEGKDKKINNPNYLQTKFLPKFCMSLTWDLLQTNTHYYNYPEGNKQT